MNLLVIIIRKYQVQFAYSHSPIINDFIIEKYFIPLQA